MEDKDKLKTRTKTNQGKDKDKDNHIDDVKGKELTIVINHLAISKSETGSNVPPPLP